MSAVENYIYQLDENQKQIMFYFHDLFTRELNLMDKIRYKIPFYYGKSWICYLNPTKDNKVELAFIRGNELSNVQGLLVSNGRKQVSGISFQKVAEIPEIVIREIIHEAILLDEIKPYASKNKKK
ncbi:MAG: DUF1801 domain-containing protein [Chitinophagales bacterium]